MPGLQSSHKCPALFITAPGSNHGKTTITAAIARYFARRGMDVRVFKTGPDFLDPMILERASGRKVFQLDLWMMGEERCRALLHEAADTADLILVEGVMGFYDGDPSSADLCAMFGIPAVLVVDSSGIAQSLNAITLGFSAYRTDVEFAGVVANRVGSERHAEMLRDDRGGSSMSMLACFPRDEKIAFPSRHLGLFQATELENIDSMLDKAADSVAGTPLATMPSLVHFRAPSDSIEAVGVGRGALHAPSESVEEAGVGRSALQAPCDFIEAAGVCRGALHAPIAGIREHVLSGKTVAVARDQAFSFIYEDNLDWLRSCGANILEFSPLLDSSLPDADIVYLPGGYPELHAEALCGQVTIQKALKDHVNAGRRIYAECGGMLYLLDELVDANGVPSKMLGLLPGRAVMQKRLCALGYQEVKIGNEVARGHTFHYSKLSMHLTPALRGQKRSDGKDGESLYENGTIIASYLHLYFPSAPGAATYLLTGMSMQAQPMCAGSESPLGSLQKLK